MFDLVSFEGTLEDLLMVSIKVGRKGIIVDQPPCYSLLCYCDFNTRQEQFKG